MGYKEDNIACLKKSLADVRSSGVILTLENLMTRKDEEGNVTHRLFKDKNTPIKTVDELIALIDLDNTEFLEVTGTGDRYFGTYTGIRLVVRNAFLVLNDTITSDRVICANWFGWKTSNLAFTMHQNIDGDTSLKVKAAYLTLYQSKDL